MSVTAHLALSFAILSLLSIGGANATLPEMHRVVVDQWHWMDDRTFASLIAIAQTSPGPNVLIVSMIGWQVAGLGGMLAATLAMLLPSSALTLAVGRLVHHYAEVPWVDRLRTALAPVAVGLMLASGYVMSRAAGQGVVAGAIIAAVAFLVVATERSPLYGIAGGALVAVVGHRLHWPGL